MTDTQRAAIEQLKQSEAVVVGPELIAQALGMNPSVLRQHVKDGDYKISAVEVCGSRFRFFRKDFLQKIGEAPLDPEERTDSDRLDELIELLQVQNMMLMEISACIRKTASCGNS